MAVRELKKKTISKRKMFWGAALLLVSICLLTAFFSPVFILRQIKVSGNVYLQDMEICRIAGAKLGSNMLRLHTDEMTSALEQDLRIEEAVVKREFPSGLDIQIVERRPMAVVACSYGYLELDRQGVVLAAHRTLLPAYRPVLTGTSFGSDVYIGDARADPLVEGCLSFHDMIGAEGRAELSEVNLSDPAHIIAYTNNGVQIRIGNLERLEEKAHITDDFLRELHTAKYPIEYIDFNFSSPFIKFKGVGE